MHHISSLHWGIEFAQLLWGYISCHQVIAGGHNLSIQRSPTVLDVILERFFFFVFSPVFQEKITPMFCHITIQ